MISTLIKKELHDNILSFKFIACALVAIILIIISTVFLSNDYRDRLKNYNAGVSLARENLQNVEVYSQLEVKIFKKPNPLSIFVSGIEGEIGNYIELNHKDIPASLKGSGIKNEFTFMFSFFDISSVIIYIFTLLAILLSYSSISGEKEEGTLLLALANSVPRYKFLLGKYLSMITSLVIPLTLCFGTGILMVFFSKDIEKNKEFFCSLGLLYVYSIIYLSSILLLGIYVSSRTKKSFESLLFLLAFYLITVFVLPLGVANLFERKVATSTINFDKNIQNIENERDNKIEEALKKFPHRQTWRLVGETSGKGGMILKRINPPQYLEFLKMFLPIQQNIMMEYAAKANDYRKRDDQIADRIEKIRDRLLAFLPSENYDGSAILIAGTGKDDLKSYLRQLASYWRQYVRYLDDKNAFGLRYYYPYQDEFTPEEKELIDKINKDYALDSHVLQYFGKYYDEAINHNPQIQYLNLNDMPIFNFYGGGIPEKITSTLFDTLILLFYNFFLFILSFQSFNRCDPRRA